MNIHPAMFIAVSPVVFISFKENLMNILIPDKIEKVKKLF